MNWSRLLLVAAVAVFVINSYDCSIILGGSFPITAISLMLVLPMAKPTYSSQLRIENSPVSVRVKWNLSPKKYFKAFRGYLRETFVRHHPMNRRNSKST